MAVNVITTKQKPWRSLGSEKEIEAESLPKEKPSRSVVHFSARREVFLKRKNVNNFVNRDAMDEGAMVLRPLKDRDQWVLRQELDVGVQAVRPTGELHTQTPYYRKVSMAVQAHPPVVDARLQPGKEEPAMDPNMRTFFGKVLPRVMHHLTQNTAVPIFCDDYVKLAQDDTFVGSRDDNYLREAGNYFHHYTRDKEITSIDWRPGKFAIAVAVTAPVNLEERFLQARHVESAVSLVWNLNEQASPQFILEAPSDVMCIKFCPTKPHVVVAGLANGQVAQWDLSIEADSKTRHAKQAPKSRQVQHGGEDVTVIPRFDPPVPGQTLEKSGDHQVWRLKPKMLSRVEHAHRRAVKDIQWLPPETECGYDIKFVEPKEGQNQFTTIGEDGVVYLWDLRPDRLPDAKKRRVKNSKIPGDHPTWVPMLKWNLVKPDGGGDLMGLRFHMECRDAHGAPQYLMCCSTVEGEFATCYWGPKEEASGSTGFDDGGARVESKTVRTLTQAHAGPAWAVQRHPSLPDYYLTVGDWGFKIWKAGLQSPILASPLFDQQVTCGRWSPTRPAVLYIGTRDGWIQVWDLLDRSHERLFATQAVQEAITVLEFKPGTDKRTNAQYLAVGTRNFNVRLYEVPKKLVREHQNERHLTERFFEREARRVAYFGWRWKQRQVEMDAKMQQRAEPGKGARGDDLDHADDDADYTIGGETEDEFRRLVKELNVDDEDVEDDE